MSTDFVLETDTPRRLRPPVFILGLIAILAVVFFVGRALFFDTGGASTPEEAVQDLAGAISNEDMAGALAALSPHEMSAVSETYQAGADKAKELGLTGEGGTFGFLDLEVSGLQLDVDELGPDIAKVTITEGTATAELHPERLSPMVDDMATGLVPSYEDDAGEEIDSTLEPEQGEITAADLRADIDGEQVDPFVVVVREEGGWYVSPFHTIAEYLMIGADDDVPRPTYTKAELPPAAPTPIAAVERLVDAINARSVDGVIDSVSADEWAVLHTYRGAVEYVLEDALGEIDPDADLKIDDIDLSAKETGDGRAVVVPKSFTAHVTVPASDADDFSDGLSIGSGDFSSVDEEFLDEEFTDDNESDDSVEDSAAEPTGPVTYTIEFDGKCFRVEGGEEPVDTCEIAKELEQNGDGNLDLVPDFGAMGRLSLGAGSSALDADQLEDVGIVVVAERDGWAISPLETLFGAMTAGIESITPEAFAALTGTQASMAPQAKVAMGGSTEVTINDSGFAVVGVKATKGEMFRLTTDDDDAMVGDIMDPDGKLAGGAFDFDGGPAGTAEPEKTGEYRAVIHGKPGSTVTVSMAPYSVPPVPTVDLREEFHVELEPGVDMSTTTVRVRVPKAALIAVDGPAGLALSIEDEGQYGTAIFVEAGEVEVDVSNEMDEAVSADVSIVALEPEALDVDTPTELSLDEGERRFFSFTAPVGRPVIEAGEEAYLTVYEADSGEVTYDPVLEEGREYLLLVEALDGRLDSTIGFVTPKLDIDGEGTTVEWEWDPELGEEGDYFGVTIPDRTVVTLTVVPDATLDVSVDVSCESGDDYSVDDGAEGATESILVPEYLGARQCDLYVTGGTTPGSYTINVAPA